MSDYVPPSPDGTTAAPSNCNAGGEVVPPRACRRSRQELDALLKECDYGKKHDAYEAYFYNCKKQLGEFEACAANFGTAVTDWQHRCVACGQTAGDHAAPPPVTVLQPMLPVQYQLPAALEQSAKAVWKGPLESIPAPSPAAPVLPAPVNTTPAVPEVPGSQFYCFLCKTHLSGKRSAHNHAAHPQRKRPR